MRAPLTGAFHSAGAARDGNRSGPGTRFNTKWYICQYKSLCFPINIKSFIVSISGRDDATEGPPPQRQPQPKTVERAGFFITLSVARFAPMDKKGEILKVFTTGTLSASFR
jgi:hypothetical protein